MKINRLTMLGAALVLASVATFGTLFSYGAYPAAAGEQTPEYTPTFDPCDEFGLVQQECISPTMETPVKVKTHTPTATATAAATETSVPSTSVPATNTPVPPTGGQEGAGVRPPNTGTGDGTRTASEVWAVILGAALLSAGAGTFVVGMRRR